MESFLIFYHLLFGLAYRVDMRASLLRSLDSQRLFTYNIKAGLAKFVPLPPLISSRFY